MDWKHELAKPLFFERGHAVSLAEALTMPMEKVAAYLPKASAKPARSALKDRQFSEVNDDEIDYELDTPNKFFGTHGNLIPMQSAVAGPRVFYGARFANQALPIVNPEAPLVQALSDDDADGRSFDEILGEHAGALRAKEAGVVKSVTPDEIEFVGEDGKARKIGLYNHFGFNRKTEIHHTPTIKPGDQIQPGQLLADSNYTKGGTLAMGLNARVGLVPYLGKSMDDAIVISESFAKRLTKSQLYGHELEFKRGVKGGKNHYTGIFPQRFVNAQLDKIDDDGVVKVGQTVENGDPIVLATKPRIVSSANAQLGLLSKTMRNSRVDGAQVWDHHSPGVVTDVKKLKNGVKVNISTNSPTTIGDKLTYRTGQKGVVSEVIPDDRMPRLVSGEPLEVLLNPLSLPSRVNNSLLYEILLGKVAKKTGTPYKLPTFNKPGEKWYDFVEQELKKNGLTDAEEVFDPAMGKKLENPITVGNAYVQALHHTGESKLSVRGQGSYTSEGLPAHGGGDAARAKRLSGLESNALLSSGAYSILREGATVRGSRNDDYWRQLRMGHDPKDPGSPFVYSKFRALLNGAGMLARKLPGGKERLQFWTDKDLDKVNPIDVKNGESVDLGTLEPVKGGLFDPALTGANAWGQIRLPFPVPNPAATDVVRSLLGLTQKDFRAVLAGEKELPPHLLISK